MTTRVSWEALARTTLIGFGLVLTAQVFRLPVDFDPNGLAKALSLAGALAGLCLAVAPRRLLRYVLCGSFALGAGAVGLGIVSLVESPNLGLLFGGLGAMGGSLIGLGARLPAVTAAFPRSRPATPWQGAAVASLWVFVVLSSSLSGGPLAVVLWPVAVLVVGAGVALVLEGVRER